MIKIEGNEQFHTGKEEKEIIQHTFSEKDLIIRQD